MVVFFFHILYFISLLYTFSILVFYLYGQCVCKSMENRQYNLRSANRDIIQVPVQLQIENTDFMSTVLNQNNDSYSDSASDSNDSQSELDCFGLLDLFQWEKFHKKS